MTTELSRPYRVHDLIVLASASAGVATRRPGDDPDRLLARADADMYRMKQANFASR